MCDSAREAAGPGGDSAQWWRWEEPPFGNALTAGWQAGRLAPGTSMPARPFAGQAHALASWRATACSPVAQAREPGSVPCQDQRKRSLALARPPLLRSGHRLRLQRPGASPAPAVRALLLSRQLTTGTHLLACGRRVSASSSSSSGRASHRGCRSPTTTVARRLRSAWRFCSASFMASISEEGVQG